MSAADCRGGTCSCAAISDRLPDTERTVRQCLQVGWLNNDGTYTWSGSAIFWVSPVWADHTKAARSAPGVLIEHLDGWLIYHRTPAVLDAIARIRWEHTNG